MAGDFPPAGNPACRVSNAARFKQALSANADPASKVSPDDTAGRVPDTLDLAEHGRLALNGLLGTLDPALDYEAYFLTFFEVHPPYMVHWSGMVSGEMPNYLAALPMVRLMCGSREKLEIQDGFMAAMLKNMAGDGLVYDRAAPNRPWNTGVQYGVKNWDEDYANMSGNARLIGGLISWHQWTGDPKWKVFARRTAERMLGLAIVRGSTAYYPNPGLGNNFSYPGKSGWTKTDPPERPDEGFEGGILGHLFSNLHGFARYYATSGDERFLELAKKFVNFGLQPKFWGADHDMHPASGAQRGHFKGHYTNYVLAVRYLLDYALVANDERPEAVLFATPTIGPNRMASRGSDCSKATATRRAAPSLTWSNWPRL